MNHKSPNKSLDKFIVTVFLLAVIVASVNYSLGSYGSTFVNNIIARLHSALAPSSLSDSQIAAVIKGTLPDLVAYYAFEESSGTTGVDSSGGKTVALQGASWTSGKSDGAISLDGVDDYAITDYSPKFNSTGFTISLWVNPSSIPSPSPSASGVPSTNISTNLIGDSGADTRGIRITNGSKIDVMLGGFTNGTNALRDGSVNLSVGTWQMITVTYDASSRVVTVYQNGSQTSSKTLSSPIADWGGNVTFSKRMSVKEYFPGSIDEARFYSRALTSNEISSLYALDLSGNSQTQVVQPVSPTPALIETASKPSPVVQPVLTTATTTQTITLVDKKAPVISSITKINISTSSATINWKTDEASDSQLAYGLTNKYGATTTLDSSKVLVHSVNLRDLKPLTTYNVRVRSADASGNTAFSSNTTFKTTAFVAVTQTLSTTETVLTTKATTTTVEQKAIILVPDIVDATASLSADSVFNSPIMPSDISSTVTEWVDGKETTPKFTSGPRQGKDISGGIFLLPNSSVKNPHYVTNGYYSFSPSDTPGIRHIRTTLSRPIKLGSLLVSAPAGTRVSVLSPTASLPGNINNENDWITAQDITISASDPTDTYKYSNFILPENTTTQAIRVSYTSADNESPYYGKIGAVYPLQGRYTNIAPSAEVITSSQLSLAPRINNGFYDGFSVWANIGAKDDLSNLSLVSDTNSPTVMLVWPNKVPLKGVNVLNAGFKSAQIQKYIGPDSLHPREASDANWQTIAVKDDFFHGSLRSLKPNFVDFGGVVSTRAIRIKITKPYSDSEPDGNNYAQNRTGKRVWVGEVQAYTDSSGITTSGVEEEIVPIVEKPVDITPPISFDLTLPKAGYLTLVIEDSQGKRVRNLFQNTYYSAGKHTFYWDGVDDCCKVNVNKDGAYTIQGKVVTDGDYRARGIIHDKISETYFGSFNSPGTPPWFTAIGSQGAWLSDHRPASDILYIPDGSSFGSGEQVVIGSVLAEGGHAIAALDLNGRKLGGTRAVGDAWSGARYLAYDLGPNKVTNDAGYSLGYFNNKIFLGSLSKRANSAPTFVTYTPSTFSSALGLAVYNGLIVANIPSDGKLALFDASRKSLIRTISSGGIGDIYFDKNGSLFAISSNRRQIIKFNGITSDTTSLPEYSVIINSSLTDANSLTINGANGDIYVSDSGTDQVKVFNSAGKFLRSIGEPKLNSLVGVYNPLRMNSPRGITITSDSKLWVAEQSELPKRVSVWNLDGTLSRAYYGPGKYASGGTIDPKDSSHIYYVGESEGGIEISKNWSTGSERVVNIYSDANVGGLGSAFKAPETPIYSGGNQYMTNTYVAKPTNGTGLGGLWIYKGDHIEPVAAFGDAEDWPLLGGPTATSEFRSRIPSGSGKKFFIWFDSNHNGSVESSEINVTTVASSNIRVSVSNDLSVIVNHGFRITATLDAQGVPHYDINNRQNIATNPTLKFSSGGGDMIFTGTYGILSGGPIIGYKNGEIQWTYPATSPNLHASHVAPLSPYPGYVIGTTRFVGPAFKVSGETLFGINGNFGNVYLFTEDGMFVDELGADSRNPLSRTWNMGSASKGMSLEGVSYSEEDFWPTITKNDNDGNVYVSAGKEHSSIIKIDGLSSIQRISPVTFSVPRSKIAEVTEYFQMLQSAKTTAQGRDTLKVSSPSSAISVDGNVQDWSPYGFVQIDATVRNSTPAKGAIALTDSTLYAAYTTGDAKLLSNTGVGNNDLFKTGGALDLMIGTDPNASLSRTAPVQGDLRLLVTRKGNATTGPVKAVIYRPVSRNKNNPIDFSSPWRTITFDEVQDVSQYVTLAQSGGNYEFSIPLSVIGLNPPSNSTILGDIGILRGSSNSTIQRVYWQNKSTGTVSDAPSEAELTPSLWGLLKIGTTPFEAPPSIPIPPVVTVIDVTEQEREVANAPVAEVRPPVTQAPPISTSPEPVVSPEIPVVVKPDSSKTDSDGDGIKDDKDNCRNTPSRLYSHVDKTGCPVPKSDKFDIKPDFKNEDSKRANRLKIGIRKYGDVSFTFSSPIDLTDSNAQFDDRLDLDKYVTIQQNKIHIDSEKIPALNVPATVTLYGITADSPKILSDGVECKICKIVSYNKETGVLIFTVPHFSTYEIVEGNSPSPSVSPPSSQTQSAPPPPAPPSSSGPSSSGPSSSASTPSSSSQNTSSSSGGSRSSSSVVTVSTPPVLINTDISRGSLGADVTTLQKFLIREGYIPTGIPFGNFGPITENAIKTYQCRVQAICSGISYGKVSGTTRTMINNALSTMPIVTSTSTMISTPISSRTLALGLRGEDVLRLQKFMNQNGFVLANSSYGSAGKETTYYGPLLRNAVIRFQESYTSTLLTPRGLTKGTGIVDSLTLKKINELAVKKPLR